MPGLLTTNEQGQIARGQVKHRDPRDRSRRDTDPITVAPMGQTTGYGVNGPQWLADSGPPPLHYGRSPYSTIALPPVESESMTLHPLLTPEGADGILWDIRENPASVFFTPGLPQRAVRSRYHWKTFPACSDPCAKSLTIFVPTFESPIVVMPVDGRITIWDVMMAVYEGIARFSAEREFVASHAVGGLHPHFHARSLRGLWKGLVRSRTMRDAWDLRVDRGYS